MLLPDDLNRIDAIQGWMGMRELLWQANLASLVSSWTEVGSYHGRSAMAVGLSLPMGSTLNLVDTEIRPELAKNVELLSIKRPSINVNVYKMPSVEAAKKVVRSTVVFIDASHDYESVKADLLAWQDKCLILCGHDYQPNWVGVVKAVNEMCPRVSNPVDDIWVRVV